MTKQEAIKIPSMTKREAIEILRDTPIDIRSTREDDIYTLYATAQLMAIEALEKQIPKKPYHVTEGDEHGYPIFAFVNCPICDEVLNRFNGAYEIERLPYCYKCGQRIDWSDGDEEPRVY